MSTIRVLDGACSTTAPAESVFTHDQWQALGKRLFGDAGRDWRWICPACGGVQTPQMFLDRERGDMTKDDACNMAATECIKRSATLTRGGRDIRADECDWVAWGLFKGPWFVVMDQDKIVGGEVSREYVVACFRFDGVTTDDIKAVKEMNIVKEK